MSMNYTKIHELVVKSGNKCPLLCADETKNTCIIERGELGNKKFYSLSKPITDDSGGTSMYTVVYWEDGRMSLDSSAS